MQPNVSAIGKIDLDDTDNVIASADAISVAQKAGTFVGDAAANVIDWTAIQSDQWSDKITLNMSNPNTLTDFVFTADFTDSNLLRYADQGPLLSPALLPNRKDRFAPSKVVFRRIPTG